MPEESQTNTPENAFSQASIQWQTEQKLNPLPTQAEAIINLNKNVELLVADQFFSLPKDQNSFNK